MLDLIEPLPDCKAATSLDVTSDAILILLENYAQTRSLKSSVVSLESTPPLLLKTQLSIVLSLHESAGS